MVVSWTSGWQLQGNLTFQVVTDEGFSIQNIFLKPLIPTSDQGRISCNNINTIPGRKVTGIKKNINYRIAW